MEGKVGGVYMSIKLEYEFIKKQFEERNYELLETEYIPTT